jgi:hypothetical protein
MIHMSHDGHLLLMCDITNPMPTVGHRKHSSLYCCERVLCLHSCCLAMRWSNTPQYVEESVNTKFLGLQVDNHLNGKRHIDQLVPQLSGACYAVTQIYNTYQQQVEHVMQLDLWYLSATVMNSYCLKMTHPFKGMCKLHTLRILMYMHGCI